MSTHPNASINTCDYIVKFLVSVVDIEFRFSTRTYLILDAKFKYSNMSYHIVNMSIMHLNSGPYHALTNSVNFWGDVKSLKS